MHSVVSRQISWASANHKSINSNPLSHGGVILSPSTNHRSALSNPTIPHSTVIIPSDSMQHAFSLTFSLTLEMTLGKFTCVTMDKDLEWQTVAFQSTDSHNKTVTGIYIVIDEKSSQTCILHFYC